MLVNSYGKNCAVLTNMDPQGMRKWSLYFQERGRVGHSSGESSTEVTTSSGVRNGQFTV